MKVLEEIEIHFNEGMRPPPDFTVSEWADKHRSLPKASSSEPGLWRTSRTPYLKEIMDVMSPNSHYSDVVVMKGSQVGFTEALLNITLFYMAHAPGPILSVQPTIGIAEKFSKQRLSPSILECVPLREKVADNKSRDGGNTVLQKDFPGGTLILGGANSAANLRSMPIKTLLLDEVDAYPEDCDGEGDPVELAKKRTTNFSQRKRLYGSTPTIGGISRIEKLFNDSDQRYYFVPCPFCKHKQVLRWVNIKFENRDPKTVRLICENESCKASIYERHKTAMLEQGEWQKKNPESDIAGFHISALYSPIGWYSWVDVVRDHLVALGDAMKRKVWTNTVLGEVWDDSTNSIDHHWLYKRKEPYAATVPNGSVCITAGVDTQDDRLEAQVVGWGNEGESWVIDYSVFYGDPHKIDVWNNLDLYLSRPWRHEVHGEMIIGSTCVDAGGHCTDEVYSFCKPRQFRHIFPTFGRSGVGKQLVGKAVKSKRAGTFVFFLGVDQGKSTIYSRLKLPEQGPGYVHFPDKLPSFTGEVRELQEAYFSGLTSEKKILKQGSGLPKFEWVLPAGKRNEPLDTMVLAMAALQILNPNIVDLTRKKLVYSPISNTSATVRGQRRIINSGIRR